MLVVAKGKVVAPWRFLLLTLATGVAGLAGTIRTSVALKAVSGPSIAIVTAGSGSAELITDRPSEAIATGQVFFVPAKSQPVFTP